MSFRAGSSGPSGPIHRTVYRVTGRRLALRDATPTRWGTLRLTTIGRRSGRTRIAILGYIEDGPNLVTLAMNGWANPEPAWWLNLQAHPDATVDLLTGEREVTARIANPNERPRLWARFVDLNSSAFTEAAAALRSTETAVVILEPRSDAQTSSEHGRSIH